MPAKKSTRKTTKKKKASNTGYGKSGRKVTLQNAAKDLVPKKQPTTKTPKPDSLTVDQERFCQVYVSATEFFGNGTQSYIEAYDVQVTNNAGSKKKLEKGKRKQMTYGSVREAATRLLTNENILNRINELLEEGGFNDAFVDKQLKFLITQSADPRVKLGAIQEFNKLMARIQDKQHVLHSFAADDMSDEELMRFIEEKKKFFNKE